MREKTQFEKHKHIEDIRNETGTIWLNLRELETEGMYVCLTMLHVNYVHE